MAGLPAVSKELRTSAASKRIEDFSPCAFCAFLWLNVFTMPALIIHGHFYQPPRENAWTGIVEQQPSAAPFHYWNERIHVECYRANAFAAINDPSTGEERIVNNYADISFNFGPSLLNWLEQNHRDTYNRILEADREGALQHHDHGNAIAQAYGHAILPLCNEHDLR